LHSGDTSADPTMAARMAIEYSHGKLDPALQRSLLLLAPFTATIPAKGALDVYIAQLRTDLTGQDLDGIDLSAAVAELQRVGLATAHPALVGYLTVVPILPYFLRNRLRDNADLDKSCRQAHHELYSAVASMIEELLTGTTSGDRMLGQAAANAEYANLAGALGHGQATGQSVLSIVRALFHFLRQKQQHDACQRLYYSCGSRNDVG
jgi:hypothetical protein